MGAMQKYLIALLVFSTLIAGFGFVYNSLQTDYSPTYAIDLTAYQKINQSYELVEDIHTAVKGGTVSAADTLVRLFNGGLAVLKLMVSGVVSGVTIPIDIVSLMISDFKIPEIYLTVVITGVLLMLLFTIVSAVFKHPV